MATSNLTLRHLNGATAPHRVFTGHLPGDTDTFVPRMETLFLLGLCGGQNDSPTTKDVHILIPEIVNMLYYMSKGN